jgi:hypothetical protein
MTTIRPALVSHTERLNGRVKMLATKDNGGCRNRNPALQTNKQTPIATLFETPFDCYLSGQMDMCADPLFWTCGPGCAALCYKPLYNCATCVLVPVFG